MSELPAVVEGTGKRKSVEISKLSILPTVSETNAVKQLRISAHTPTINLPRGNRRRGTVGHINLSGTNAISGLNSPTVRLRRSLSFSIEDKDSQSFLNSIGAKYNNLNVIDDTDEMKFHDPCLYTVESAWRKVIASRSKFGRRLLQTLKAESTTYRQFCEEKCQTDDNSNAEVKSDSSRGKELLFWLSRCISRASEPHFILRELTLLEKLGIDRSAFEVFMKVATDELFSHSQLSDRERLTWDTIITRLTTLLSPPKCDDCQSRMERKIPSDVKPPNTRDPFRGFIADEQSRNDTVAYCAECQSGLASADLYFECPQCGPNGVIKVIRGGRLRKIIKRRRGSSVCLNCVTKQVTMAQAQKEINDNVINAADKTTVGTVIEEDGDVTPISDIDEEEPK